MRKEITLNDIAGYATERMVWQMMLNLSDSHAFGRLKGITSHQVAIFGQEFLLRETKTADTGNRAAFSAPETFHIRKEDPTEASGIWTIGALAFFAITGTNVFEGKGGETQTDKTGIPRLSSAHAGQELSALIHRCLSYLPQDRPTKEEIRQQARAALTEPAVPRKRLTSQAGKSYTKSLIKFWPEEMIPLLLLCLLLLFPVNILAQSRQGFDKTSIPNEMVRLVLRCIDLRLPQNTGKVSRELDRDMNWTMMDELPLDKNGECTTKDLVDVFGLNDIGFSILKRHGGATNAGGRFRDGRDPRYKYSFIEITVKRGKTVSYHINGREGEQIFAIVPHDKQARFEANIPHGETFTYDGVCYIRLRQQIKKNDSFTLTLKNNSCKNMAFALINYNSQNHE